MNYITLKLKSAWSAIKRWISTRFDNVEKEASLLHKCCITVIVSKIPLPIAWYAVAVIIVKILGDDIQLMLGVRLADITPIFDVALALFVFTLNAHVACLLLLFAAVSLFTRLSEIVKRRAKLTAVNELIKEV